jgi:hypothetical protein
MFESWIIISHSISLNGREETAYKIWLNFNEITYKNLKENYIKHYKKLINIYLEKKDAWDFLDDYTIKEKGYYLPKNNKIKEFVEYFYSVYKDIWNKIEE